MWLSFCSWLVELCASVSVSAGVAVGNTKDDFEIVDEGFVIVSFFVVLRSGVFETVGSRTRMLG